VDLDNDGNQDILSGSYSRSDPEMAGLFQVLHGQADGTFKRAEVLNGTDGEPLIIPVEKENWIENICTRPFAVDWDGDGDLDLVVGNFAGSFYLFQGEGQGKFQPKPEQLKSSDEPLKIDGHHSDPFVIDWDGDGDLDLLSGSSSGGVQWSENIAGAGKPPNLRRFRSLVDPWVQFQYGQPLREDDLKGPVSSTRVWADDVNGDGKLDLLVGDMLSIAAKDAGPSDEELETKRTDWQKSLDEAVQRLNEPFESDQEREKAIQRFKELSTQRGEFRKKPASESTGFVWLYLQK
jgi:hypothetical protein